MHDCSVSLKSSGRALKELYLRFRLDVKCMSLAGSGFLGLYLIGASACLQKQVPDLLRRVAFAGSSAGALVACGLACGVPLDTARLCFLQAAARAQKTLGGPFWAGLTIQEQMRRALQRHLPTDAHLRATGRLFVSLTRPRDMANVVCREWASREDLIDAVLCSCYIPGLSGFQVPTLAGTHYIDGGFTDRQPVPYPATTLTISPFENKAHICPPISQGPPFRDTTLLRYYRSVVPAPPHVMMAYYWQGYRDAEAYLKRPSGVPPFH